MPQSELAMAKRSSASRPRRCSARRRRWRRRSRELVARLQRSPPQVVVTCARGSSAHAATFGKHLIERHLGIPVAAAAPNIATVYGQRLRLEGPAVPRHLAVGPQRRPDRHGRMAQGGGRAHRGASSTTPRARWPRPATSCCRWRPGRSSSVAATQDLRRDARRAAAPDRGVDGRSALGRGRRRGCRSGSPRRRALDWSAALRAAGRDATSLVTIGRGPTLAIAREAALKLKETCNLHAEAFSGAEFLHGPVALVSRRLSDPDVHADRRGGSRHARSLPPICAARARRCSPPRPGERSHGRLPALAPDHPDTDAVCLIQSFYALPSASPQRRGTDVDRPRHLQKVTRTR